MRGFVELQHFASVDHTSTLFLYSYRKKQFCSLFLFHVVPVSPSLPHPSTLETYTPFAAMSAGQYDVIFSMSSNIKIFM
jgi:hypothetical protein